MHTRHRAGPHAAQAYRGPTAGVGAVMLGVARRAALGWQRVVQMGFFALQWETNGRDGRIVAERRQNG